MSRMSTGGVPSPLPAPRPPPSTSPAPPDRAREDRGAPRGPGMSELTDHVQQLAAAAGVQARGRFVGEEPLGGVREARGEAEPTADLAGGGAYETVRGARVRSEGSSSSAMCPRAAWVRSSARRTNAMRFTVRVSASSTAADLPARRMRRRISSGWEVTSMRVTRATPSSAGRRVVRIEMVVVLLALFARSVPKIFRVRRRGRARPGRACCQRPCSFSRTCSPCRRATACRTRRGGTRSSRRAWGRSWAPS